MNVKGPAIVACILWGSAFAAAKIGFEYMEPMRLSGVRFTLAGLMLLPVLFLKKISIRETFIHWKFILFFAFLQSFLQYGLFFMGLNKGDTIGIIALGGNCEKQTVLQACENLENFMQYLYRGLHTSIEVSKELCYNIF